MKYCLRQKTNLVRFINHYVKELGRPENKVLSSNQMPGGKVLVVEGKTNFFDICKNELAELKTAGNIPYDMLFLVPSDMVLKGTRRFSKTTEFEKNGFIIWDGTQDETRSTYSILGDEERVLQYDSARGLEAWTVVCMDLDVFLEEKMSLYDTSAEANPLLLESEADRKLTYLLNWLLIPLTRAIDTLVITVRDATSDTAKQLRKLAEESPDYVTLYQEV